VSVRALPRPRSERGGSRAETRRMEGWSWGGDLVSDTYMAPPAAEDLIEALAACLREHVEERKRELAHAQENTEADS